MLTRLAIFDLDGTLIDSLTDLADAMNAVLEDLGHPTHPRHAYRYMVGNGIEVLVRRALPPGTIDTSDIPQIVHHMRREYSTRWTATTRPFPEIPELLIALNARNIRAAVLSNKPDFATREIVSELFPNNPFSIVQGALDDVPLKPDPTSALQITNELGVAPRQTAFIGDTAVDMATGVNAGMQSHGVTWGFRDAEELLAHGANFIANRPLEILGSLEGDPGRDRS